MESELAQLGLDAARQVAGDDAVEDVEVMPDADFDDRPVYHFSFLINEARLRERGGLVRLRLLQRLRDELTASGDEHLPRITMLSRTDWAKRRRA
jgi:hypothetical protein